MKIATARIQGKEFVGIIKDDKIINVNFCYPNTLIECMEQGVEFKDIFQKKIPRTYMYNLDEVELLAPIPKPRKNIICVGKNYVDHATEMGMNELSEDMTIFTKALTSMTGSNTVIPSHKEITTQLDYEGELAIVIGKCGRNISEDDALDYIFGYTIINDITARDIQERHQQFFLGKSLDFSCPVSSYIETEIKTPQNLQITTKVNGEVRQQSNTSQMLYTIPTIISTISKYMTLEAGDIIATGTPAGVGKGMNPPTFLQSGDSIEIEIEELGILMNTIG